MNCAAICVRIAAAFSTAAPKQTQQLYSRQLLSQYLTVQTMVSS